MPPKNNSAAKSKKKQGGKKGGKPPSNSLVEKPNLQKNPKKKTPDGGSANDQPAKAVNTTRAKKGAPRGAKATAKSKSTETKESDDDMVSLSPRDSDDDFSMSSDRDSPAENTSSNAVASEQSVANVQSTGNEDLVAARIDKHVDAALDKYFRKKRRDRKKGKKKRRKRDRESSSSSSEGSSSETDNQSDSESSSQSELSDDSDRGRKRKRKEKKRKERKERRGEKRLKSLTAKSPSTSTVYTRGCKSPQNAVMTESSNDSLNAGSVQSDADTDEFIASLNTSRDHSTPDLGRRARSRSPGRGTDRQQKERQRRAESNNRRLVEDQYQEQSDRVIRDLQQNKGELAKPSGGLNQFMLSSLLRDFKHFHLTSHVDRKIRESIKSNDFTVDFRKLLPRSRSKTKSDNRLNVVHQDGATFFVPAGEKDLKDISGYKTWEVAFKVFMGIFNQSWPDRMQELLQYSHIIQTAALNHPWENVYNYNIAFREIMTEQPNTHWGVISQHTWTLELGDHSVGVAVSNTANHAVVKQDSTAVQKAKNPCWRFNKGRCNFGANCEFDHRCSHCGKRGHGRHECYKRLKTEKGKEVKRERVTKN